MATIQSITMDIITQSILKRHKGIWIGSNSGNKGYFFTKRIYCIEKIEKAGIVCVENMKTRKNKV